MWNTLHDKVLVQHADKISLLHYNYVQPWHPQSAIMHEVALAVELVDATKYNTFADKLFKNQQNFFDGQVYEKSRRQLHEELVKLAADDLERCEKDVLKLLGHNNAGDYSMGKDVMQMMKFYTKFGRKRGIHVTPTCLVNGIVVDSISSGWDANKWTQFLGECTLSKGSLKREREGAGDESKSKAAKM